MASKANIDFPTSKHGDALAKETKYHVLIWLHLSKLPMTVYDSNLLFLFFLTHALATFTSNTIIHRH